MISVTARRGRPWEIVAVATGVTLAAAGAAAGDRGLAALAGLGVVALAMLVLQRPAAAVARGRSHLVTLLVVPYVVMSIAAFAAQNYQVAYGVTQPLLRLQGLVVVAIAALVLLGDREDQVPVHAGIVLPLAALAVIGTTTALALGNDLSYVLGDLSKLVLTILVLHLVHSRVASGSTTPEAVWRTLAWWTTVGIAVALALHVAVVAVLGYRRLGGEVLIPFIAALEGLDKRDRKLRRRSMAILAMVLVAIMATANRGSLVLALAALLLYLARPVALRTGARGAARGLRVAGSVAVMVIVAMGVLSTTGQGRAIVGGAASRVQSALTKGESDVTINSRFGEIDAITAQRAGAGVWERTIGFGLGASLDPQGPFAAEIESRGAGGAHSVHNTYYSILFRHGVVGLAVMTIVLLQVLAAAWRGRREPSGYVLLVWLVLVLGAAVAAYGLLGDLYWAVLAGAILGADTRRRRGTARPLDGESAAVPLAG